MDTTQKPKKRFCERRGIAASAATSFSRETQAQIEMSQLEQKITFEGQMITSVPGIFYL